ncbi:MAG: hypothetical protein HYZ92_02225 [Candidatus Omnitrophica bacterium]|nr:hypothetical protein [Candidatus Omnitrophota bacterium]
MALKLLRVGAVLTILSGGATLARAAVAEDEANAAVWYEEALAKFQEPSWEVRVHDERAKVLREGWHEPHPLLTAHIEQNANALALFKRGAKLASCDFRKGQPRPHGLKAATEPLSPVLESPKFGNLVRAVLLEARQDEWEHRDAQALENDLLVLRMAHHLGQTPQLGVVWQRIWTGMAYQPLVQLVQRSSLKAEQWRQALEELQALQVAPVGIARMLEAGLDDLCTDWDELLHAEVQTGKVDGERVEQFLRECHRLENEYGNSFSSAVSRYAPEEFDQKVAALAQQVQQEAQQASLADPSLPHLADPAELLSHNDAAELEAKILFSVDLPKYSEMIPRFYVSQAQMNVLMGAMAVRLYELERGAAPDNLDALVPSVLARLPEDPFAGGSPLRYTRDGGSWRLYSIGPDRKDQGGTQPLPRDKPEGDGDIVVAATREQ